MKISSPPDYGPRATEMHQEDALGLAMIEPDRPHNFGGALRLAACLGIELHLVEPCGFPLSDRRIREGALDYAKAARWYRHQRSQDFMRLATARGRRLLLLTTRAALPFTDVAYRPDDMLAVGSESRGAPEWLHEHATLRVLVPMRPGVRSLNVLSAATIVLTEAMRQTGRFGSLAAERARTPDEQRT